MKKCLIVVNSFKESAVNLAKEITRFLAEKSIVADTFEYHNKGETGKKVETSFDGYTFVITLGGDGTVLFAARGSAPLGIPVLSVNLGEFGFLASVQTSDWKEQLTSYLNGTAYVSERSLIEAEVLRGGKTVFRTNCMNDIVISSIATSRLVNLGVTFKSASLGLFKANGLIVSTPTGSTGYSAAAGGPILDASLNAMVLTPISSFSLSARPLVFGSDGEIAITVLPSRVDVELSADGQIPLALEEGDVIILSLSEYKAKLLCTSQETFYSSLQNKLNWAGGPRA